MRALILLIVLAAGASAAAAMSATKTHVPPSRYKAGTAIGYTYGSLDEIRLDVSYAPDEAGPYEGVPREGFTDRGHYYEPVAWSEPAEDGSVIVTYAERPASDAPEETPGRNGAVAAACAAAAILPMAAAAAMASPKTATNEKHPYKKGKSS